MESVFDFLNQISFLVDAGLVVLIWMVQLIVYPSFLYYKTKNLITWHEKYTTRIAIIVVPLMITQLVYALLAAFYAPTTEHFVYLFIVVFLWFFTFIAFAPLHFKISQNESNHKMLKTLLHRNWIRTILWSFLLVFHWYIKA